MIQILCRRKKNNPVLIGEPGVGKTAIAEGLAQRIVEGKIPDLLSDKRIVTLDLAAVVAGTKYRGQFEERLKAIMNEIRESHDAIIFIDELHTIVGAGGAEGAIDASNMLKPALARGEIQCIGATTLDEYRKYIEKDGALERRFQPIMVDPPSVLETMDIILRPARQYEAHHGVKFTEEAIRAAVYLSDRYISDRFLPDKAIDVMDEAGSRARLSLSTVPPELREMEKQIDELSKEKEAAIQNQEFEKAAGFRDKEKDLRKQLANLKREWNETRSMRTTQVDEEDDRLRHQQDDRDPGLQPGGERVGEAPAHGGAAAGEGRRAGRGGAGGRLAPFAATAPACAIRAGPSAASSSSAPPGWARPSWPGCWPSSSSTIPTP